MQKADGNAFHSVLLQDRQQRADACLIERYEFTAMDVHALGHGEAPGPWHQGLRLFDHEVVLVVTALVSDFQHVAETLGGDQCTERALALDNGVGRKCRAEYQQRHGAGFDTRARQDVTNAGDHALIRRTLGRQNLGRHLTVTGLQHDVGEGAANIHRQAYALLRHRHLL